MSESTRSLALRCLAADLYVPPTPPPRVIFGRNPMELIIPICALYTVYCTVLVRPSSFNPTRSAAPGGVTFMHSGRIVNVFSARDFGPGHDSGAVNDGGMVLLVIDDAGHLRLRAKRLLRST